MGERTSYAPGTFSWAELATSDSGAAKDFYSDLFGWSYDDNPVGDGQIYSIALRDSRRVGALFASEQPPHWNCYVTVASADDAAARAAEHGATVLAEPFDVLEAGRMATIADPQGAALCVWEPRATIGAELVNGPGALTWCDLLTPDADAAADFYAALFGWATNEMPGAGGYRVIRLGERSNGGMMPFAVAGLPAEAPASWLPYFGHEDTGRAIEQVRGSGGTLVNGPTQVPAGTFAAVADPQGAAFAVLSGQYDD
jgi:predicted enzyme related to lactoylglutathione lyase